MNRPVVVAAADGDTVLISISGDIDLSNAADVERELRTAVSNQATSVMIDLAGVTYFDSMGARVLFDIARRLATAQIHLTLVAPLGTPVRRLVEISGLAAAVDVQPADEV